MIRGHFAALYWIYGNVFDRALGLTVHQRVIDKVIVRVRVSRVPLELFIAPYSESDPRRPVFGCCTLLA